MPVTAWAAVVPLALLAAACTQPSAAHPGLSPAVLARNAEAVLGRAAPGGQVGLVAATCPTAEHCWAVGSLAAGISAAEPGTTTTGGAVIVATSDAGRSWHVQLGAAGSRSSALAAGVALDAVSCAGAVRCMAVGGTTAAPPAAAVLVTADRGRAWTAATAPPGAIGLAGVQCAGAGPACTVLATNGTNWYSASTTDGGSSWEQGGALPAGFAGPGGLACDGDRCLVAGYTPTTPDHGTGAIAVSGDGGANWDLATVPAGSGLLHAVSCAAGTCLAVGTTSTVTTGVSPGPGLVLASTDGGTTFSSRPAPAGLGDGLGVSCPAASVCAAVGTRWTATIPATPLPAVVTTGDLGARFTTPLQRFVPGPLQAVACLPAECFAAGGDQLAHFELPPAPRSAAPRSPGEGGGAAGLALSPSDR